MALDYGSKISDEKVNWYDTDNYLKCTAEIKEEKITDKNVNNYDT